jgi:hypothetical protein
MELVRQIEKSTHAHDTGLAYLPATSGFPESGVGKQRLDGWSLNSYREDLLVLRKMHIRAITKMVHFGY